MLQFTPIYDNWRTIYLINFDTLIRYGSKPISFIAPLLCCHVNSVACAYKYTQHLVVVNIPKFVL